MFSAIKCIESERFASCGQSESLPLCCSTSAMGIAAVNFLAWLFPGA